MGLSEGWRASLARGPTSETSRGIARASGPVRVAAWRVSHRRVRPCAAACWTSGRARACHSEALGGRILLAGGVASRSRWVVAGRGAGAVGGTARNRGGASCRAARVLAPLR